MPLPISLCSFYSHSIYTKLRVSSFQSTSPQLVQKKTKDHDYSLAEVSVKVLAVLPLSSRPSHKRRKSSRISVVCSPKTPFASLHHLPPLPAGLPGGSRFNSRSCITFPNEHEKLSFQLERSIKLLTASMSFLQCAPWSCFKILHWQC